MKQRELKRIAKQIAMQEKILQDPASTTKMKSEAETIITRLSLQCVASLEDVDMLDELIQEYLSEK
jgi:hypothetical protein